MSWLQYVMFLICYYKIMMYTRNIHAFWKTAEPVSQLSLQNHRVYPRFDFKLYLDHVMVFYKRYARIKYRCCYIWLTSNCGECINDRIIAIVHIAPSLCFLKMLLMISCNKTFIKISLRTITVYHTNGRDIYWHTILKIDILTTLQFSWQMITRKIYLWTDLIWLSYDTALFPPQTSSWTNGWNTSKKSYLLLVLFMANNTNHMH